MYQVGGSASGQFLRELSVKMKIFTKFLAQYNTHETCVGTVAGQSHICVLPSRLRIPALELEHITTTFYNQLLKEIPTVSGRVTYLFAVTLEN